MSYRRTCDWMHEPCQHRVENRCEAGWLRWNDCLNSRSTEDANADVTRSEACNECMALRGVRNTPCDDKGRGCDRAGPTQEEQDAPDIPG